MYPEGTLVGRSIRVFDSSVRSTGNVRCICPANNAAVVTTHKLPAPNKNLRLSKPPRQVNLFSINHGLTTGVGRGLGVAVDLGVAVGVGLGVAVAVGVGVGVVGSWINSTRPPLPN